MRLLYSARTPADLRYRDELGDETTIRLSSSEGRIDGLSVAGLAYDGGLAFVCGTHGFVETAADHLMAAGYSAEQIKTERYDPSG